MSLEQKTVGQRYRILRTIARGGMAVVYEATDEVLARPVALKVLDGRLAEDDNFVERFRREALSAARLTHPHVVGIYDTGVDETEEASPLHYIVMENCAGGSLAELVRTEGPLEPGRVAAVGVAVCEALGYGHKHGVVHRDVKPANILFASDGTVKVGDFGIAKAVADTTSLTQSGAVLGSAAYVSPEQARSEEPDARSDIYALGAVLYELLVGRPPFVADSPIATALKHIEEPPAAPRSIRAGIPRRLETAILRALSKDPDDRFGSAQEFASALRSVAASDEPTAMISPVKERRPPPQQPEPAGGETLRSLWPVALLIAAAVALVAFLPSLIGTDENGNGGNGGNGTSGDGSRIEVTSIEDFDPHGDDASEHPEDVQFAVDGNPATAWSTSSYNAPLSILKPGVGLLIDLGESVDVQTVEILTTTPGMSLELRAADEVSSDETGFEVVSAEPALAGQAQIDAETGARYWLLWITDLPGGGGGSAAIAEVRFFG